MFFYFIIDNMFRFNVFFYGFMYVFISFFVVFVLYFEVFFCGVFYYVICICYEFSNDVVKFRVDSFCDGGFCFVGLSC